MSKRNAAMICLVLIASISTPSERTAAASGLYMCNCSLTCSPKERRVGAHGAYHALSESTAASMCLSDAADSCFKKHEGTGTSNPAARCR